MGWEFRRLSPSDYALMAGWIGAPHVAPWFNDEPATVEHVRSEYDSDPMSPGFIALLDGEPVGWVQCYVVADDPNLTPHVDIAGAVGVDLLVGSPSHIGRGLGPRMLVAFLDVVRGLHPWAPAVIADPQAANVRSVRCFEKAGFVRGAVLADDVQLMVRRLNPP